MHMAVTTSRKRTMERSRGKRPRRRAARGNGRRWIIISWLSSSPLAFLSGDRERQEEGSSEDRREVERWLCACTSSKLLSMACIWRQRASSETKSMTAAILAGISLLLPISSRRER